MGVRPLFGKNQIGSEKRKLIRKGCKRALERAHEIKPFKLASLYVMTDRFGNQIEEENILTAVSKATDPNGTK